MVKLVAKLLEINNYNQIKNEFEELFLSHPNYPSLFAITDSLDLLSVENIAVNVPKDQLLDMPESFLAFFKNNLVLVNKTNKAIKITNQNDNAQNISYDAFASDWNGIIVAIEPNENSVKETNYNLKELKYGLPLLVLALLSIFSNRYNFFDFVFLGTSITGLIISVFVIQEKFGIKNEIASKFCNIGAITSCDSVIKSEKNKFLKWGNFYQWPIIFFSTSVASLLLQPSNSSAFIGFLSLISFPVLFYSIWMQKFQIKKWCVLCLAISFLLITQGLTWVFLSGFTLNFTSSIFFMFFALLASMYFIWKLIKPIIHNTINAQAELKQMIKFKRNYSLLSFLSKEIPSPEGFEDLKSLDFGNKESSLHLSIIISPSCGHCHKVFKDSFNLVSKFPDRVFLRVLFNINPENNNNPYKVIADILMALNKTEPLKVEEAISDWHIKKLDLKQWTEKWNTIPLNPSISQNLQEQYDWCLKNEFNYTPVKIINGKQFPNGYELSDLKYFLNDFEEENKFLETIHHN
ncbi:vitamin K epoxide reductase family protein [Flavobacterium sp. KJJ]|uniref:vitamin K epoxide reductase family protein n=1 Tax=Flavobacterium sp. KJJ TaxID=1270193 RepID=UPI000492FD97|nr:vitamin K epoxide reductase family protein [Flavobacterium sp. KJJ]